MRPAGHIILSAGSGFLLGLWLKSYPAALAYFLSGIFIDVDHFLDYYLARKKITFSYKDLVYYCDFDKGGKLYLIFHAYEFLFIFWLMSFSYEFNDAALGIGLGVTVHLICDALTNPVKPLTYFIIYRIQKGFDKRQLLSEKYWRKFD